MVRSATTAFASEVDMLMPLAQACPALMQQRLHGGRWSALFEVPVGDGVADLCAVRFSPQHAHHRSGRPAIRHWTDILAFAVIQHSDPAIDIADLSMAVSMSVPGLRRGPLARLTESDHVRWINARQLAPCWRYTIPITGVATVEAKLSDWRRGLAQARRHTVFADASYIALPPRPAALAAGAELVAASQVGVLSVEPTGRMQMLIEAPAPPRPREWALRRMYAAEQLWAIYSTGAASGPVAPVFGKSGAWRISDPRMTTVAVTC